MLFLRRTKNHLMKTSILKLSLVLAAGMILAGVSNVQAVHFDYSSTAGSAIVFPGDTTFHFTTDGAGHNFMVSNGTAAGLLGEMTGTYTIGTITTSGGVSTASVSGTGTFVIHDGANLFTATLTWVDITQNGTGDNLNITGQVNLTAISYTGSNADLVALRNAGNGANVLSFQFVPAVTLATLRNGPGPNSTSFSGSVGTLPDGGTTVALLGLALTGLEGLRRRMKKAKARI
jgi:hypothetical protein